MKAKTLLSIVLIDKDEYDLMLLCNSLKSEIFSYRITPFCNIDDAIMFLDHSESGSPDILMISSEILSSWEKMLAAIFKNDEKWKNTSLIVLLHSKEEKHKFTHLNLPSESFIPRRELFKSSYYEMNPNWSSLTDLKFRYN